MTYYNPFPEIWSQMKWVYLNWSRSPDGSPEDKKWRSLLDHLLFDLLKHIKNEKTLRPTAGFKSLNDPKPVIKSSNEGLTA